MDYPRPQALCLGEREAFARADSLSAPSPDASGEGRSLRILNRALPAQACRSRRRLTQALPSVRASPFTRHAEEAPHRGCVTAPPPLWTPASTAIYGDVVLFALTRPWQVQQCLRALPPTSLRTSSLPSSASFEWASLDFWVSAYHTLRYCGCSAARILRKKSVYVCMYVCMCVCMCVCVCVSVAILVQARP